MRSGFAQQVEQGAGFYPPTVYERLRYATGLITSEDSLSAEYVPLSQAAFAGKNIKPLIIGFLPPQVSITGRVLDRTKALGESVPAPLTGAAATGQPGIAGQPDAGSEVRNRAVALLKTYVGLSMEPSKKERYLEMLAPASIESRATALALGNQASCAPTTRGWLRELGSREPELMQPYRWGEAINDVLAIADRKGARIKVPPKPGDIFFLSGEHQHMAMVERVEGDPSKGFFYTYDVSGGQRVGYNPEEDDGWRGIDRAKRVWKMRDDGTWIVNRDDSAGGARPLAALMDLELMLEGTTPTGSEGVIPPSISGEDATPYVGDARVDWTGAGGKSASVAAKELAKTAGTLVQAPLTAAEANDIQRIYAAALRDAVDLMASTPPLRMLVNPSSFSVSCEKVIADGNYSRDGAIVEQWGDAQDKIEASGKLAGFYALDRNSLLDGSTGNGPGLTRAARNLSGSFAQFLSLALVYRNNGVVFLPDPSYRDRLDPVLAGSVFIYYDSTVYFGSFDSFDVTETAESPHTVEYSYSFTVRHTFPLEDSPV
jgi:hypothetical protein